CGPLACCGVQLDRLVKDGRRARTEHSCCLGERQSADRQAEDAHARQDPIAAGELERNECRGDKDDYRTDEQSCGQRNLAWAYRVAHEDDSAASRLSQAISAGVSATSSAPRQSSSSATVAGPISAKTSSGYWSTHARATWRRVQPFSSASSSARRYRSQLAAE